MKSNRLLEISRTLLRLHNEVHEALKDHKAEMQDDLKLLAITVGKGEYLARFIAYKMEHEENQ